MCTVGSLKQTDIVEVAELPLAFDEPQKSKKCIMLGWGDTKGSGLANVLKEVEIPIVSNEQCNDDRWRSCGIRSCMMCAGGKDEAPCAVSTKLPKNKFLKYKSILKTI